MTEDPGCTLLQRWLSRVLELVASVDDMLGERVIEARVPAWATKRGWDGYLTGLTDDAVEACEVRGLEAWTEDRASEAPANLVDLAREVAKLTRTSSLEATGQVISGLCFRSVSQRKEAQLQVLLDACRGMALRSDRVVDVGAGCGHLTRLAAQVWQRPALGVEREASRVEVARKLSDDVRASYVCMDVTDCGLCLDNGDLVMGLHACGDLGDAVVREAAQARARLVLISCCFQKTRALVRTGLSQVAQRGGLRVGRDTLGLANLRARDKGVEWTLAETMKAREARYGLRLLLLQRGLELGPGAEMRGVNRRRSYRGLGELAVCALAHRGMASPTQQELECCEARASREYGLVRRLSLPRCLLSRLVEVAIVLDRAVYLEEQGYAVRVAKVFDDVISPRNLGIFAEPLG